MVTRAERLTVALFLAAAGAAVARYRARYSYSPIHVYLGARHAA